MVFMSVVDYAEPWFIICHRSVREIGQMEYMHAKF